jgi:hypothetical protein
MLLTAVKERIDGEDVFTSRLDSEVVQNLNPKFELRGTIIDFLSCFGKMTIWSN